MCSSEDIIVDRQTQTDRQTRSLQYSAGVHDVIVDDAIDVFAVVVSWPQTTAASLVPNYTTLGWLGSRVVGVLDSGAEGPGFKSQPRRCRVTVSGKLFTPIVPLFTKQRNW